MSSGFIMVSALIGSGVIIIIIGIGIGIGIGMGIDIGISRKKSDYCQIAHAESKLVVRATVLCGMQANLRYVFKFK